MVEKAPANTHMWRVESTLRERFPTAEIRMTTSQPFIAGSIFFKLLSKSLILECGPKADFEIVHYHASLGDMGERTKSLHEILDRMTKAYGVHQQPPSKDKMEVILHFLKDRYPSCIVSIDTDAPQKGGYVDIIYGGHRVVIECYKNGGYAVSGKVPVYGDYRGTLRTDFRDAVRDIDTLILSDGNKGEQYIRYQRVETSATRFGDDWPGVFIRGDECHHYLLQLQMVLEIMEQADRTSGLSDVLALNAVRSLIALFKSSNIESGAEFQRLKPADDCLIIPIPEG